MTTHEEDLAMAKAMRDALASFKLAWLTAHTAGLRVDLNNAFGRLGVINDPDALKPDALLVARPL